MQHGRPALLDAEPVQDVCGRPLPTLPDPGGVSIDSPVGVVEAAAGNTQGLTGREGACAHAFRVCGGVVDARLSRCLAASGQAANRLSRPARSNRPAR